MMSYFVEHDGEDFEIRVVTPLTQESHAAAIRETKRIVDEQPPVQFQPFRPSPQVVADIQAMGAKMDFEEHDIRNSIDDFDFERLSRCFTRSEIGKKTTVSLYRQPIRDKLEILAELGLIQWHKIYNMGRLTIVSFTRLR